MFIVISPSLTESDKFLTLLEVSGMDPLKAMGVLQITWSHILRNNPSGNLGEDGLSMLRQGLSDALSCVYSDPDESLCTTSLESIPGLLVDSGFLRWDDGHLRVPGWDEWSGRTLTERKKKTQAQARWRKKKKKAPCRDLQAKGRDLQGGDGRHLQGNSRHLHTECRHLQLETHENNRESSESPDQKEKEGVSLISNYNYNNNNSFGPFTKDQVEAGEADHLTPARILATDSIKEAFAQVHRETWGSKVSPHSQELLKAVKALCVKEKRKPSEVCRAVKGMAKDPWKKRKEHNAWRYVVRDVDKWLSLADDQSLLKNNNMDWGPWKDEGYDTKEEWERAKK